MAHASATSSMRRCTSGSNARGELGSGFGFPVTKYMPDTFGGAGSVARCTYHSAARLGSTAAKNGTRRDIANRNSAGPSKCSPSSLLTIPGSSRFEVTHAQPTAAPGYRSMR